MSWFEDNRLLLLLLPISFVSIGLLRRLLTNRSLPPGPPGLPLIGNVLSLDPAEPWKTYAKWGAKYGDIFYYRIFSQEVVVINSEEIAKDLLERRSSNYSDRPFFPVRIPFGWANHFGWMPYGSEWRLARRFFLQSFHAEAALSFRPMQLRKTHTLLQNLLATPESYFDHLAIFAGSIIMAANYDYDMKSTDDPMFPIIERGLVGLQYLTPETTLILDAFPFLLRLPGWFPGTDLKRKAALSSEYASRMIETPLSYALEKINAGTAAPCLTSDLMNRKKSDGVTPEADYDLAVKQASWSAF
ncbi:cytochrome P450, partial [Hygrophoropsis aurantiaca]